MSHVLHEPGPLSDRAQAYLAGCARLVPVDTGPGDDECRTVMRAALGYCDEEALATLRRIQRRYSGLTYQSPFRGAQIVFEPVFECGVGRAEYWYAIMDVVPDGCRSCVVLPDDTVWFGLFDADALTFPSLDHFLECDALLDLAGRQHRVSIESPPDGNDHLVTLRGRHPGLCRLDSASGFCVEWWADDERLVYFNGLDAALAADGHGTSPVPTVVTTWLLDEPLRPPLFGD